jgi:hypothetical protein
MLVLPTTMMQGLHLFGLYLQLKMTKIKQFRLTKNSTTKFSCSLGTGSVFTFSAAFGAIVTILTLNKKSLKLNQTLLNSWLFNEKDREEEHVLIFFQPL